MSQTQTLMPKIRLTSKPYRPRKGKNGKPDMPPMRCELCELRVECKQNVFNQRGMALCEALLVEGVI